jgi:uncharacterized iron-regulated protein
MISSKPVILLIFSLLFSGFVSDKPAYRVFDTNGKAASYSDIIDAASKADIVFIGELHNNPIAHWLELEVTRDIFDVRGNRLVTGAEMFERDNQLLLDEYLGNRYGSDKFEAEAKLWKNYTTDYKPLVEFAKKNGLRFVATNIPRRYASMVNKGGFEALDSLTAEAKKYIAPLPMPYDPDIESYKAMLEMGGPHSNENMPKAQASKDATMAWSILENYSEGSIFIHYNGSYHSSNMEGIIWYLNHYNPGLKIVTVEAVTQKDISKLDEENIGVASFVVAIPDDMTTTY